VLDHLHEPATVPPFLVMHGDVDQRVGIGQGRRLHAGLTAAGVRSRFVEVPGAEHGAAQWGAPEVVDHVVAHLEECWAS
jgi:dipeptidyl aminopeptidase/acylaminoacyl peptidase